MTPQELQGAMDRVSRDGLHGAAWVAELDALSTNVFAYQLSLQCAVARGIGVSPALDRFISDCMPLWQAFERQNADRIATEPLPASHRWFVRGIKREQALAAHRDDDAERAIAALCQDAQQVMRSRSFCFRGEHVGAGQLHGALASPDRAHREAAFRCWTQGMADSEDELWRVMQQLVQKRQQLGHGDYEAYRTEELKRDFDGDDVQRFLDTLQFGEDLRERRQVLGVHALRPWDFRAGELRDDVLFTTQEQAVALTRRLLVRIHPRLADVLQTLHDNDSLDLMTRNGKASGASCYPLMPLGLPFVFANATGRAMDLLAIVHEIGHATHFLATEHQPVLAYRRANIEISEVASITLELLMLEHLHEEVDPEIARGLRSWRHRRVGTLYRTATRVDRWQRWLYKQTKPTLQQVNQRWAELSLHTDDVTDWTGMEHARARGWQAIRHVVVHPFYFVEYAWASQVAQQILAMYQSDRHAALQVYFRLLALGGSCSSREALDRVGLHDPMG